MPIDWGMLGQVNIPHGGVIAQGQPSGGGGGGGDGGIGDIFSGLSGLIGGMAGGGSHPYVGGGTAQNTMNQIINNPSIQSPVNVAGYHPPMGGQPNFSLNPNNNISAIGARQNFNLNPANNMNLVNPTTGLQGSLHDQTSLGNYGNLLQRPAFQTAFNAQQKAMQAGITKSPILTVVDYSLPANQPRMWVLDTSQNKILMNTYVAQGATPGFSNIPNSHQSSLGTFLTQNPYHSDKMNRDALKIQGLDKGINDNAFARGIVVHGGNYIGPDKQGTSWGCFTVPNDVAPKLIGLTQGGTIIHAYAPDQKSLSNFSQGLTTAGQQQLQHTLMNGSNPTNQIMNPQQTHQDSRGNISYSMPQASGNALEQSTGLLRHYEEYTPHASWDVNAYRAGFGSDTTTLANGTVVKVRPGMTVDQASAERDLQRRTQEFQNIAARQVGDTWGRLPANVQAGLTSVAYNYGSLPRDVASAAKTGDPRQIANAVMNHARDNKGVNRDRRIGEANYILQNIQNNPVNQVSQPTSTPPANPNINNTANNSIRQGLTLNDEQGVIPGYVRIPRTIPTAPSVPTQPGQAGLPNAPNMPNQSNPQASSQGQDQVQPGINWGLLNRIYSA